VVTSFSSRRRRPVRTLIHSLVDRLPGPRADAARSVLSASKALVLGRPVATEVYTAESSGRPSALAAPTVAEGPKLPKQPALPEMQWPEPPAVQSAGMATRHDTGAKPPRYDADLLEQLNKEYADNPIVTSAPSYQQGNLAERARRRLRWVHNMIGLTDQRVLEIGCGNGVELWYAARMLGAEAYGVDVQEYASWPVLAAEPNVHLQCADLAADQPFEADYFDRITSFTVWEHVTHPYAMLREAHRVLKPGGLFWLRANLYPGTKASHRYRDINFPWPHLLFSDDVVNEWYRRQGMPERGVSWVNRLSWLHYRSYFARLGFRLRSVKFDRSEFDEEFYRRFEDILGRFPRWDLSTEFFLAVLEKPSLGTELPAPHR
jgi:SAM-dependent methyltransferase